MSPLAACSNSSSSSSGRALLQSTAKEGGGGDGWGNGGVEEEEEEGKKEDTLLAPSSPLSPHKASAIERGGTKNRRRRKGGGGDGPSWCPNAPPPLPLSRRRHLRRQHSFLRHWHGLLLVLRDGSSYKKGAPESTSEIYQLSTAMSKRHQAQGFMMTSEGFQRYGLGKSHTTPMEGGLCCCRVSTVRRSTHRPPHARAAAVLRRLSEALSPAEACKQGDVTGSVAQ